ncbi:MAG: MFS transporter [Pseudomonadota bacterium]
MSTPESNMSRFIAASGLTNFADGIATVAWAWLATLITRDPLLVALVPVALRLPWFLCAIPAGIVTDRVDRRRLILAMDAIRGIAFCGVTLSLHVNAPLLAAPDSGVSSPALFAAILIAAAIVGVAEVFRDNAAQTMLPSLVSHDRLEHANGRLWSVELVGNALLGPAVGAFLIGYAVQAPFAVNAAIYGCAVILFLSLNGRFRPVLTQTGSWRADLREAVQFLLNAPLLRALAWITGFWNLFFEMVMIALVLHVQENLGLTAQAYGLLLAAGALGGIVGGWCGEHVVRRLGPKRSAQWMLACSPPAFLGVLMAPGAVSLAVVLFLFNVTGLIWNIVSVSYRQRHIPDALLGRVNSLYRLLAWGMMPVGLILSGGLVNIGETLIARELALTVPFVVATYGSGALAWIGWHAIGRGFDAQP